ncbi:MAG: hypothetical protein NTW19_15480 [Planctomycetota bacterium]|nr:hypothetical protein [Planctomycetota bacterium]
MKCPYCRETTSILDDHPEPVFEQDYRAALAKCEDDATLHETLVFKCPGCGANSTLEPDMTAGACAFCGSPYVGVAQSRKAIAPQAVLPFAVNRAQAVELYRRWIASRWFAPGDLERTSAKEGGLTGMYVPYWTFDCDADTAYSGQRGDDYWTTETYTAREGDRTVTRTRQVRRTRWTSVSGRVFNHFNDILVLASQSLPQKYVDALEPWELGGITPYRDDFLSGFRAQSYQIDLPDGFEIAKDKTIDTIRRTICQDIGGDHQTISGTNVNYDRITYKHLLLPIWISAYQYEGKVYRFVVNGQTGEVQGERPYSWVKILFAVLGALIGLALLALVIAMMQQS